VRLIAQATNNDPTPAWLVTSGIAEDLLPPE
jgi:hypothetical protein